MSEAIDGVDKKEIWTVSYGSTPYITKVSKCEVCGKYRGEMFSPETSTSRPITCLCQGFLCHRCKKNNTYRRGTEIMDEKRKIWHVPYFATTCEECRRASAPDWLKKERAEEAQGRSSPDRQPSGGGRDWLKFAEECFPPEPQPKGPYGEG